MSPKDFFILVTTLSLIGRCTETSRAVFRRIKVLAGAMFKKAIVEFRFQYRCREGVMTLEFSLSIPCI